MKIRKLDARGFSHHFIMVLVVLVVAIGGTYYLVASHADSSSSLDGPQSVAVNSGGIVYVADTGNNMVKEVAPTGSISTIAGNGNGGAPTPGPATSSAISPPTGVAVDSSGNVYFVDFNNHVIDKVTPSGTLSVFAGIVGQGGAPTAGLATHSELSSPVGVAVDSAGNVYIADQGILGGANNVIEKVTPSGALSIIAGEIGASGPPTPGPATSSRLNYPQGVAVDSAGNVYISDGHNNMIEKVTPAGILSIVAGDLEAPGEVTTSGTTVVAPQIIANAGLNFPHDIAVDSAGNVYVADTGNNLVKKITMSTGAASIIAGNGNGGVPTVGPATYSALNGPTGVAVDSSGNVYIADRGNNLVEKVAPSDSLSIFAGGGTATPSGPPAAPTNLQATVVSSSQINLNWTPSAGATGYLIYRSGGTVSNVILSTTGTSYENTGLSPGTRYSYYVIATNSEGTKGEESPPSYTLSAVTTSAVPAAPTNLTATAVSTSQINLAWNASPGATSYTVSRYTTASPASPAPVTVVGDTNLTNFANTGLPAGTNWVYFVKAVNSVGQSADSGVATATTFAASSSPGSSSGEQLSFPPQRRPAQYLSLCEVGTTGYVSNGTSNCWAGGTLLENYSPSVTGTYYDVPCVSVNASNSASDRFVYIAPGEGCPGQTTPVPLQLLSGEQLSFPPTIRPVSYLTQCSSGSIQYVSLNSCVYRLPDTTYLFTYTPPVAGTYYSVPCATVTQGGLYRYLYVSATESCPADTFGNLER